MAPWIRFLEAWMVQQLLRTPAFHRAVEGVARRVHRFRHNLPPEQPGGTAIDHDSHTPGFARHFLDELKAQAGGGTGQSSSHRLNSGDSYIGSNFDTNTQKASRSSTRTGQQAGERVAMEEEVYDSDRAWRGIQEQAARPPKQSFGEAYLETLREQVRNNKPKG